MTRTLTGPMITAAQADSGDLLHLISLAFSGGTLFLTTAPHDVVFSGDTYTAVGGHLGFSSVNESGDLTGQGVRLTLDGVDQTIISPLLAQNYIGRIAKVYQAHMDSAGVLIVDPVLLFEGLLNSSFTVSESRDPDAGGTVVVTTTVVSPLVSFRQQRGIRATLASHQHHFPGDTFWKHISIISARGVPWPGVSGGGDNGGIGGEIEIFPPFIPGDDGAVI